MTVHIWNFDKDIKIEGKNRINGTCRSNLKKTTTNNIKKPM